MTDFTLKTTGTGAAYLDDTGNYTTPTASAGVSSVNSLTGAVTLAAGTNVTLGTVGNTVTINSTGGSQIYFPNEVAGYFPEGRTPTKIRFYNGSISNGASNPLCSISTQGNTSPQYIDVDFTINGPGGLDTGSLATDQGYYFYALRNTADTATTIVASTAITYGGVSFTNLTGYSTAKMAKIPFGIVNKATIGLPDFRIHGWPSMTPEIYLHDIDSSNKVLTGGTATSYTTFNVRTGSTAWLPDNSRRALLQYILTSTGSACDLFFQNAGSSSNLYVASVPANGKVAGTWWQTTSSIGDIKYKLSGSGANVDLRVIGYAQSEA